MAKGKFIIIEGLDYAGKRTQSQLLLEYLKAKNIDVIATNEPTLDNPIGKLIERWLDKKFELNSDEAIMLLYVADRYEHLAKTIIPELEKGKTVICVRYYYSALAYDNALFGVDTNWIKQIYKYAIKPHIKIFIDTPPEECISRVGYTKRLEKLETLQKIYESYQKVLREDKDFYVINGSRTRAEIFEDVKNILEKPQGFLRTKFSNILNSIKKPWEKPTP